MKTILQCIIFLVTAILFAASTVCCIVDDKWIDHSVLNYAHTHACHATNCPVCGAQYEAQFDSQHVQKAIALASDELSAWLDFSYTSTFKPQEPFCIALTVDISPHSDCTSLIVPLRI